MDVWRCEEWEVGSVVVGSGRWEVGGDGDGDGDGNGNSNSNTTPSKPIHTHPHNSLPPLLFFPSLLPR